MSAPVSAPMNAPVIEARGLIKQYGQATAVAGIDLVIEKGEIFGLLGPNGAGKTTVILMLLGLTDRDAGSVSILGHDPARQPLKVKRRVGYMPDAVGFYDNLTARQNLAYVAKLAGIGRAEANEGIAHALEKVRLADVADKKVATFSRGMRQRLGLSEIWLKQAEIAILDEPTSGLDPQSTVELLDMIREFRAAGIAVLLSSHLLDRVQIVCDRVALFNHGRIALQGTVAELAKAVLGGGMVTDIEATGGDVKGVLAKLGGVRSIDALPGGKWRIHSERDITAELAGALVAAGCRLNLLALEQPSLEAIYTRYFKEQSDAA
jgi:ABC-2 type transport system ATP-binding protein